MYIHSVQKVSIPQTYILNLYHNSLPIFIKFHTRLGKWSLRNRIKFYVIRYSGCKDVTSYRFNQILPLILSIKFYLYHNSLPIFIKFHTLLRKWRLRNRIKFYVIRCSGCKDVTSQRYAKRICRNARCMTFNQRSRYHVTFATSHLCNQSTESRKIWYDYVNFSCRVVCMKFYKNW